MHNHKYHFFSRINNPNKKIEAKVKYFFDCLSIAFKFTNKHYDFPCENHKTVITSIFYQLKYNKPKYAIKNLKFYFDILAKENNIFKIFDYDTKCLTELKNYIDKPDNSKKLDDFIIPFENLLDNLEKTYFTKCFEKIKNHILSEEELDSVENNHSLIDCILDHTKLIAVEFLLTGASDKDITNIINNICNKDINNNIPLHLKTTIININEYYNSRSLKQQLNEIELIYNLFKSKQKVIFFIQPLKRIQNNVNVDLFGVKITSERPKVIDKEVYNKWLDTDNHLITNKTLYACLEINSNHSNTVNIAREIVQLALNTISKNTNNQYLLSFAYHLSENTSFVSLDKLDNFDNDIFQNRFYNYLKINKEIINKDIDEFLNSNEKIFYNGVDSINRIDILSNLWFYLEAFYENSDKAISKTSNNLAEHFKNEFSILLYYFIYENYFGDKLPYIKEIDKKNFKTELFDKIPENLKWFKMSYKHPVLIKKLLRHDEKSIKKFQNYIEIYLNQVYIYRNLYVHNLIKNEYFIGKNLDFLINLVSHFREDLISKAIK